MAKSKPNFIATEKDTMDVWLNGTKVDCEVPAFKISIDLNRYNDF